MPASAEFRPTRRHVVTAALGMTAAAITGMAAWAQTVPADLAAQLTPQQLQAYQAYLTVRGGYERQLEMYWAMIEERRAYRRQKRTSGHPFNAGDYVGEFPPKYTGPAIPPDVAKITAASQPAVPDKPLPTVADFLASANTFYGFVPTPTTEKDFKRRYAIEALAAGLTKTQVVRVYALETGGQGTIDMQSGINPITKTGKPISSALGYAQLLHANSVSELVKYGDLFAQRLTALAADPNMPAHYVPVLKAKLASLRKMHAVAKSVPNEWKDHQKLAATPQGLGIHALNLDADVGPWLQVLKLKGLLTTAAQEAGRAELTGAELELMNLAGPRTGLEMMEPVGRTMPTSNFFSQQGYYRNSIVREKTGMQLLAALDEKMNQCINYPGAVEFAAAFDEVMSGQPARQARADRVEPTVSPFDVGR